MMSRRYFCKFFLRNLEVAILISLGNSFDSLAPRNQIEPNPFRVAQ